MDYDRLMLFGSLPSAESEHSTKVQRVLLLKFVWRLCHPETHFNNFRKKEDSTYRLKLQSSGFVRSNKKSPFTTKLENNRILSCFLISSHNKAIVGQTNF